MATILANLGSHVPEGIGPKARGDLLSMFRPEVMRPTTNQQYLSGSPVSDYIDLLRLMDMLSPRRRGELPPDRRGYQESWRPLHKEMTRKLKREEERNRWRDKGSFSHILERLLKEWGFNP